MAASPKDRTGLWERQSLLIETNLTWLRQALTLLQQIDDRTYAESPPAVAPHRVGGHLRHILEFYECFLEGIQSSHIDYDARKRDESIETCRAAALARIRSIIHQLKTSPLLRGDPIIRVRREDSQARDAGDCCLVSSAGRELQVLSSHTIHHFALIAMTLRVIGFQVDRDFGMAPSTLRYLTSKQAMEAPAEAA